MIALECKILSTNLWLQLYTILSGMIVVNITKVCNESLKYYLILPC